MAASPSRQGLARWVELLQQYEADHAIRGEIDADHEVQRRLRQIFVERHEVAAKLEPTLKVIPRFFPRASKRSGAHSAQSRDPVALDQLTAQQLVRQLARSRFLQRKNQEMLVEDDLRVVFEVLRAHNSEPYVPRSASKTAPRDRGRARDEGEAAEAGDSPSGAEEDASSGDDRVSGRINYDDFCTAREALPDYLADRFFHVDTFAKFRRDEWGRVSTQMLFQYVCRHVSLYQTRIQLSMYDTQGDGYLREQDLENYIYELIPSLEALGDLQENFYPFYVFTAVRKFFFFLDPKHTCKVAIKDLVTSPILHELLHLQNYADDADREGADPFNWFSAHNTLRVYSQYLELDIDHNGMLSRSEIAGYGTGSLTTALINRVFEECLTYDGEMDYKTFLDFALAMETKKSPQSLAYFFRLLDVNKSGYLDRFTINYFFREIVQRLRELDGGVNGDVVRVEDVTDEIFDMCKPLDPARITLADLVRCGVGDTIVTMLTDLSGFWAYDNREHLIAEEAREEREDS